VWDAGYALARCPVSNHPTASRWSIVVLVLLCVSVFINYIDRGNLSTAAPLIKNALHLSATQLGLLLSSFFIAYMLGHFVTGWLVDRFEAFRMLLIGFVVWSIATILTGFAQGFATLFLFRLLLGAGESFAFPSYSRIVSQCFPEAQRGVANGSILAAMALGPAFGIFFGGLFMAAYGWRAFFIGFGLISLAWIAPWFAFGRKCVVISPPTTDAEPSLRAIMRMRSLWGSVAAATGQVYTWYFILTWIPFYLVNERHHSISQMAIIGGSAYLVTALSMMTSGSLADRWIRSGASPTLARKTFLCAGGTGCAISTMGCVLSSASGSIVFLLFAGFFYGTMVPNAFAAVQTLAGPRAAGRWVGVWNGLASASGIAAPALTGFLVDRTGNFILPFLVAASMALAGVCAWLFFVGRIEQVDWSQRATVIPGAAVASS